jgi:hypothetical protein
VTVYCYTSFSFSYLAKARVLAATLKKRHPDWALCAVISDREPAGFTFDIEKEDFDEVIWGDEIFGPETRSWIFKHDVIELCTAVKGPVLKRLLERSEAEKVFYFDPDIAVMGDLQGLADALDNASILLTPHQLDPDESRQAIFDNEVCSLRLGTYNLGFVGVRASAEGLRFASWWADRLTEFCYDDPASGLFVDQKWCDLAPAFFDDLQIVRDPGCNVASWNLSRRTIAIGKDGNIVVNGSLLKFFHFTKLGPLGDAMTQRYARENFEVYEIWSWYRRQIDRFSEAAIPAGWWKYGTFSNGAYVPKAARVLYRERPDLQMAFADPFDAEGVGFYQWLAENGVPVDAEQGVGT